MTLHATRDGQKIMIHGNTGVDITVKNSALSEVVVHEHASHVEYFHTKLGELLAAAKAEREDNA